MKMAMGCRWAACSRRTALAETSRMQCFPWGQAGWAEGDQQVAGEDGQGHRGMGTQDVGRRGQEVGQGEVTWMLKGGQWRG